MVKLSEMPCYCPCPFCKRKRPEEGKDDKQKPPEDRRERETDENMSGGNSVGGGSFPIPPIRPGEESELPRHLGPIKQLYASTGFNLAMYKDGTVKGTREQFNKWAVLELSSPAIGEVRIKGVEANLYLMMDDNGYLHAKPDGTTDDTIFLERYDHDSHYNNYISKKHEDKNWYVGIKKSGKPKKASKTAKGQNAVKFLPRPAYPKPTS